MVLGSSQISKRSVLVFHAAMDIFDHVIMSLVDTCRVEMDNVRRLNKFSRTDQNCKFARIQVVARMSNFARMFAHSQLTLVDRPIHCHLHHRQRPLIMNLRQSI